MIPAFSALSAQLALDNLVDDQGAGGIVGVAALSEAVPADVVVHIQAGHIHQLEGAHGVAQALLAGGVDVLHRGDAPLQQQAGLPGDGGVDAVGHKAGNLLLDDNGGLASLLPEGPGALHGLVAGVRALDHLHQLHHQGGVEVVQVHQPLGVPGDPGQLGADQVGAVGSQNGVRLDNFADPAKELLLDLQVLNNGLHHQFGILHALVHVGGKGEAGGHGVSLLLGDAALVHPALQVVGGPGPGAVHRLLEESVRTT